MALVLRQLDGLVAGYTDYRQNTSMPSLSYVQMLTLQMAFDLGDIGMAVDHSQVSSLEGHSPGTKINRAF